MNSASVLLLACLSAALLTVVVLDWRWRRIPNWLTLGIAIGAPLLWIADGVSLWPDVALRVAVATAVLAVLTPVFLAGGMGGGDVKLLVALTLWLRPAEAWTVMIVTAISGGVLTLVMLAEHRWRRRPTTLETPYGLAIAGAGLLVVAERYLHQFGG